MLQLSNDQLKDAIDTGVHAMFAAIQDAMGVTDGGFAAHWYDDKQEAFEEVCAEFFREYADDEAEHSRSHPRWEVGDVLVLMAPYESFPHFMLEPGESGTVVSVDEDNLSILMHNTIKGCESWNNEVIMGRELLDEYSQPALEALWKKVAHDPHRPVRQALKECVEVLTRIADAEDNEHGDVKGALNFAWSALGAAQNKESE